MAKNKKRLQTEGKLPEKKTPAVFQKKEMTKQRNKLQFRLSVGTILFITAIILVYAFFIQNKGIFNEPNGLFSLRLPENWKITEGIDAVNFDTSLGNASSSYLFCPQDSVLDKLKVDNLLSCAVFGLEKQILTPENEKLGNLELYWGYIGGIGSDPKKFVTEEIPKKGTKIIDAKEGWYSFEKGFPIAYVKSKGNIIIFNGNFTDTDNKIKIENILKSISTP